MMRRILPLLPLLFAVFQVPTSGAHHLLEVKNLTCPAEFACPEEIKARISFWISVYAKHGAKVAILHDAKVPERVYSIVETSDEPCRFNRRSKDRVSQQERERIEASLRSIAARLSEASVTWTEDERHILEMFPAKDPAEILEAADSVRCQAGNRDAFLQGLQRFGLYKDMVAEKVAKYKLSPDILYLPFVESSYNPKAFSRVGAAGLWQIMPKTARTLGLTLSSNVDQRFDPELATEAAMKYLRQSYDTLENAVESMGLPDPKNQLGPFVITSYNYGILGAKNMIQETGLEFAKGLSQYKGRRFKTAVQNFYASFMAARHVALNAQTYFGKIVPLTPQAFYASQTQRALPVQTILKALDLSETELRPLNPSLTPRVWKGIGLVPKGFELRLPTNDAVTLDRLAKLWSEPMLAPATHAREPEQTSAVDETHHKVKSGESICQIARRYQLGCDALMAWNHLTPASKILPGQLLALRESVQAAPAPQAEPEFIGPPLPPETTEKALTSVPPEQLTETFGLGEDYWVQQSQVGKKDVWVITVQSEETLGHFAEWAGVSPSAIRSANHLGKGASILLGQKLVIPFTTNERRTAFQEARIQYHKTLEDEFKERYEVVGEEIYTIRRGDSEQSIADRFEIPLWILRRFNPDQTTGRIIAGDRLRIPQIREKSPSGEGALLRDPPAAR